jgi:hypothetical protein
LALYDNNWAAVGDNSNGNEMKAEFNHNKPETLVFATYADNDNDLYWAGVLGESIRTFGGRFKNCAIWVYISDNASELDKSTLEKIDSLNITIKKCPIPGNIGSFYYSGKVFAAGEAEKAACSQFEILAWLDPDMVFVKEASDFLLSDGIDLGYRPVQLVNISSRFDEPLDEYWRRIYQLLGVSDSSVFPMTTTVDNVRIRPHFNAGMIIVRPNAGVLEKWAGNISTLMKDSLIIEMCGEKKLNNIFLHQAALAGTILSMIPRNRMRDFPPTYNYAVFLTDKMPDSLKISSLDDVVMFRHDPQFTRIEQLEKYAGSSRIFRWLKDRWRE